MELLETCASTIATAVVKRVTQIRGSAPRDIACRDTKARTALKVQGMATRSFLFKATLDYNNVSTF